MEYHPALIIAFMLEDDGHEVDWEAIYKAIEQFPPEQIDKWRQEYREGKKSSFDRKKPPFDRKKPS